MRKLNKSKSYKVIRDFGRFKVGDIIDKNTDPFLTSFEVMILMFERKFFIKELGAAPKKGKL